MIHYTESEFGNLIKCNVDQSDETINISSTLIIQHNHVIYSLQNSSLIIKEKIRDPLFYMNTLFIKF